MTTMRLEEIAAEEIRKELGIDILVSKRRVITPEDILDNVVPTEGPDYNRLHNPGYMNSMGKKAIVPAMLTLPELLALAKQHGASGFEAEFTKHPVLGGEEIQFYIGRDASGIVGIAIKPNGQKPFEHVLFDTVNRLIRAEDGVFTRIYDLEEQNIARFNQSLRREANRADLFSIALNSRLFIDYIRESEDAMAKEVRDLIKHRVFPTYHRISVKSSPLLQSLEPGRKLELRLTDIRKEEKKNACDYVLTSQALVDGQPVYNQEAVVDFNPLSAILSELENIDGTMPTSYKDVMRKARNPLDFQPAQYPLPNLEGRKLLVIGGGSYLGIGFNTARVMVEEANGTAIITEKPDRTKDLRRALEYLRGKNPDCYGMSCDVSDEESIEALFREISEKEPEGIDLVLYCPAYLDPSFLIGRTVETPLDVLTESFQVTVGGFVRVAEHAEPLLAKREGHLMAITYLGSEGHIPNYNAMGPMKAALEGFVRAAAYELGKSGVRVNAVSPGALETISSSGISQIEKAREFYEKNAPLGAVSHEDVARGIISAFRGEGSTGRVLHIDGGLHSIRVPITEYR